MRSDTGPDDRSAHTVHRLEAFSDIVMGFCLAQLGVNLVMPKSGGDAANVWANCAFFIAAFIFIALLWWMHHRTFATYFVLNLPMIVMNFGMLGGLILTLYFFESVVHVASAGNDPRIFFGLFVYAFALVYALLGGMLLFGIIARRHELSAADMRWGISQLAGIPIAVIFFVVIGIYVATTHHGSIAYAAIAVAASVFVIRRIILPRWLRRAIPDTYGSTASI
jgi:uncharacterized membrane protein